MIEQVNGAGLSGITGKSAKQGKNSLFSKLFAMLEKHAELTGQGKMGLAGKHTDNSMSKSTLMQRGDKADPLAALQSTLLKNKQALQNGEKTEKKNQAEDTATPLVAAQIIIDKAGELNKKNSTTKATVRLAGQSVAQNATNRTTADIQGPTQGQQAMLSGSLDNDMDLAGSKPLTGVPTNSKLPSESTDSALNIAQTAFGNDKATALSAKPASTTNTMQNTVDQDMAAAAKSGQAMANMSAATNSAGQAEEVNYDELVKAAHTVQSKSLSEEHIDKQPRGEHILAAMVQQQNKAGMQTQGQATSATAPASAAIINPGSGEASLNDSGSGSSDKGNQEARNFSMLSADSKSAASSSTSQSSFHSYLNNKSTPTLSVFDSMNHIAHSAKNGQTKLEIQLDPANLGKIHISLQSDASKQLQVHMIVDQSTTRAALEQQLPQLRSALAQQGFDLSGFSMGSQDQQGSAGQQQQSQKGGSFAGLSEDLPDAMPVHTPRTADHNSLSIRV